MCQMYSLESFSNVVYCVWHFKLGLGLRYIKSIVLQLLNKLGLGLRYIKSIVLQLFNKLGLGLRYIKSIILILLNKLGLGLRYITRGPWALMRSHEFNG